MTSLITQQTVLFQLKLGNYGLELELDKNLDLTD